MNEFDASFWRFLISGIGTGYVQQNKLRLKVGNGIYKKLHLIVYDKEGTHNSSLFHWKTGIELKELWDFSELFLRNQFDRETTLLSVYRVDLLNGKQLKYKYPLSEVKGIEQKEIQFSKLKACAEILISEHFST